MQYDRGRDLTASYSSYQLLKLRNFAYIGELIEQTAYMIVQLSPWGIIRFRAKQIKKLRIHDRYKEVECSVCIGDDYEKRR